MMVATRSIEECSASEISASEPIAMPTTNLAAAMPPLAKIEIAATVDLLVCVVVLMGGGLAAEGFVANCSELRGRHCEPTGRHEAPPGDRHREAIHLSACEVTMDCFRLRSLSYGGQVAWL